METAGRGAAAAAAPAAMEVTIGMESGFAGRPGADEVLRRLQALGVTSVETYVRWVDFEPRAGRIDWTVFDADVEALLRHGLRWVPFVIAGPWYATPAWFRAGPRSVLARCLEHGRETGTQSIWNPHLFPEVERLLSAFTAHYRPAGAVESLLLGVSGDYGEAIYTVTGNWPGDYHGHAGYWCGDGHALEDFRGWVRSRYADLDTLRRHWGAAPPSWEALVPPRAPREAASPQAWLDFVTWYRAAMTAWSGRWLSAARAAWPEVELYLCTGGDMHPTHGSDFSAQCQVAADAAAGVRITNEGSDFVQNLMLTRLVASAGRLHGAFYGFEPAATVTARGIAARQFNAIASGARQLHEYQGNLLGDGTGTQPSRVEVWERGRPLLTCRQPRWPVALLHSLPDLAWREAGLLGGALPLARALRASCDFAVLDDHLVARGALTGVRAVFLAPSRLWAADTAERLAAFMAGGGICIASGVRPETLCAPDGMGMLFGFGEGAEELTGISAVHPAEGAPLPAYRRQPPAHMARSYRGIHPDAEPLLQLAHVPASGERPLVMWHLRRGHGTAVFYAGTLSAGDDWMAVRGAAEALVNDLLQALPPALGLQPVILAAAPGVLETPLENGETLAWNAGDAAVPWRGAELAPGALAVRP